jgi:hypothetical protein
MLNEEEDWIAEFEAVGESELRDRLSRLRPPSRGEISHGCSLAARAGKSAQTPRRTHSPKQFIFTGAKKSKQGFEVLGHWPRPDGAFSLGCLPGLSSNHWPASDASSCSLQSAAERAGDRD